MKILCGILFVPLTGAWLVGMWNRNRVEELTDKRLKFVASHILIWSLLIVTNCISLYIACREDSLSGDIRIEKEGYGGREKNVTLELSKGDAVEEVVLTVSPRRLTDEEAAKRMEEALLDIEKRMCGEDGSPSHVTGDLNLNYDEEKYPFELECVSDCCLLVDDSGHVRNDRDDLRAMGFGAEEIASGIPVTVRISLMYEDIVKSRDIAIRVFEKEYTEVENDFLTAVDMLRKREQTALYEDGFSLPASVEGVSVRRTDAGGLRAHYIWIFGGLFGLLLLLKEREDEKNARKMRREDLLRAYPYFVNELMLLLGAGMQIKNIFQTMIAEFEKREETERAYKKPLIEELTVACHSMEVGVSEEQTCYQLGRRLELPCYIKIMTLLEQNIKRGSRGILTLLEQEELSALEDRKNLARKYGEEAGTKLLGPMILLLLIIMLIIMLPAFMCFQ